MELGVLSHGGTSGLASLVCLRYVLPPYVERPLKPVFTTAVTQWDRRAVRKERHGTHVPILSGPEGLALWKHA